MDHAGAALVAGRVVSRWRRFAVSVVLGVVTLMVVGMHQLSLGHLFVATPDHRAHTSSSSHAMTSAEPAEQASSPMTPHGGTRHGTGFGSAAVDGCAGCEDHLMGPGTCLLALTLLVLVWWLRLPRQRPLPPLHRRPRVIAPLAVRPPRPHSLSLAELSILRT